ESGAASTPSGNVTFTVDSTNTFDRPFNASGLATLVISTLSLGSHTISVTYPGDATFNSASAGPLTQFANQARTHISFASSANPSVFGQPVTVTATVAAVPPGGGIPTGTFTFSIDHVAQAPQTLDANGQATITVSNFDVNLHLVQGSYSGDGNYNPSTSDFYIQAVDNA